MGRSRRWAMWMVVLAGCGVGDDKLEGDSAFDEETAIDVWDEISDYDSWGQLAGYEGVLEATSVHTESVQIWLNDIALADAEAGEVLSDGAIVVKETYDDLDGTSLRDISILKKIDGYSDVSADIFYAQYTPDGGINTAGTPDGCVNCHLGADSNGDGLTLNE